jgi:hypothetical protein
MKITAASITAILELYYLSRWLACGKLADFFHYSSFDLKLRIEEAVHNDRGISLLLVRLFHNKVIGTLIDLYTELFRYIDSLYLVNLLSPLGVFGVLAGLYYVNKRFSWRYLLGLVGILFIFPFLETMGLLREVFPVKLILLALPLQLLSLYGIWQFTSVSKGRLLRIALVSLLLIISIMWITVFPKEFAQFCFIK